MKLPNLQIGTFVLNLELLVYIAAGFIGVLAVRYRLRGSPDRDRLVSDAGNAVLVWLLVWKGSLLLFDPAAVLKHPLSLVFFSGGIKGLWLASLLALAFIFLRNYKRAGLRETALAAAAWGATMAAVVFLALILAADSSGSWDYLGLFAAAGAALLLLGMSRKAVAQAVGMALIATMVLYAALGPAEAGGVRNQQAAPEVELTDLQGKAVRLSDYRGKTVVLNFWATWCKVCQAEMPHVEKFYQEYRDRNVAVLSVNATTQERSVRLVAEYAEEEGLSFPILLDEQGEALKSYKVRAYPATYVIDSSGNLQGRYLGALSYESLKKAVKAAER
ncbi:peroxiredoxin family protein [Cohnella boryungensis]|uniref:Peroxiredoxin family protein n=1 Tax=Cohnella boryungensis TaxID=768479 RepID=A0ABV8S954_9BACL